MSKKEIIARELESVSEKDLDALLGFIHSLKSGNAEDAAPALLVLEAVGEGTKMADHLSPVFRPAFPSSAIISERSSPSRVRFAAPNNGAPLTAPGRSGKHF